LGQAFASFWKNYVNFSGRARRAEYWKAVLGLVLCVIPLAIADVVAFPELVIETGLGLFTTLFVLAIFLPTVSLTVRRLHDSSKSGWWYLITFVPFVGNLILFIFTVLDSTAGTNKWGPSPKQAFNAGSSGIQTTTTTSGTFFKVTEEIDPDL